MNTESKLQQAKKDRELIKAQKDYIEFLGDHISGNATYLHVHRINTSDEDIKKGEDFRELIKQLSE